MENWTAYFANDPDDDYNLTVEILYEDEIVAMIKHGNNGLDLHLYSSENDLVIPFDWLYGLMTEAKRRLVRSDD